MPQSPAQKNGKLQLERGDLYAARPARRRRSRVRGPEEWKLDVEMHTAFCAIHGASGTVPSRGIYDIREGMQHPWRIIARRIKEAHAQQAPKHQVKAVIRVLEQWIDDLYAATDQPKRVA